jgi:hypothetical protein
VGVGVSLETFANTTFAFTNPGMDSVERSRTPEPRAYREVFTARLRRHTHLHTNPYRNKEQSRDPILLFAKLAYQGAEYLLQ